MEIVSAMNIAENFLGRFSKVKQEIPQRTDHVYQLEIVHFTFWDPETWIRVKVVEDNRYRRAICIEFTHDKERLGDSFNCKLFFAVHVYENAVGGCFNEESRFRFIVAHFPQREGNFDVSNYKDVRLISFILTKWAETLIDAHIPPERLG